MNTFFKNYSPQDLRDGIELELQNTDDVLSATLMAKAKLEKDPRYYKRLIEEAMQKAVPSSTYKHSNKKGAGAKKRKKLKSPQDKVEAVMHEFKQGTLHSGSGHIVTKPTQAKAIAMSEAGLSKKMKIEEKEGGNKSIPKEYKGVKKTEFADTSNYKYPLDSEAHVRAAISYLAMPRNHGKYKPAERKIIAKRIRKAAKKYNIEISEDWLKKFGVMHKAINVRIKNKFYRVRTR